MFVGLLFFAASCEKFEYNPYQTKLPGTSLPHNLNHKNIQRLMKDSVMSDDTVSFIFVGDSQRFYDELEELVKKANTIPAVDFLVLSGDISDFGLLQEFLWIHERMERLKMPYMAVIGNHDLVANGSEIYEEIFGEKNFSFVYKKHKFIFHDTNGREYNFNGKVPNISWMEQQLQDNKANWYIGVSHIPPHNVDFDRNNLEKPYVNLLSSNSRFILSLNGHMHDEGDTYHYNDHVRYITSNSVSKRELALIKLIDGKIYKEMIPY
jgi:Icc-related predicted phosphoesterase